MAYKLVFSPVFKITLQRLVSFLSRKYSTKLAHEVKASIATLLPQKLLNNPFVGPISDRLLELGVNGYRQLILDEHNIVIYRVNDDEQEILVLLIYDARQSLEKLLSEVNLII